MLNRRSFLRTLLALPIAATFDVEKLLWVPRQMIAVPTRAGWILRVSDDPTFGFGFTGWQASDTDAVISGQYLGQIRNTYAFKAMPRLSRQLFGVPAV